MTNNKNKNQMIFTTKLVESVTQDIHDAIPVKRFRNPWMKSEVGIRRSGVVFRMSDEEQAEYVKCALDINYFTEKYCKVKTDDGSIGNIKLRDYQSDIMNSFVKNRFNILMASRQVGKCFFFNTIISVETNNQQYETRIGILYYSMVSKERNLTILEKIKIKLYDLLFILEKH